MINSSKNSKKTDLPADLASSKPVLHALIRDKKKTLFEGEVAAITSYNDVGEFDVLDAHANFISIVNTVIIVNKDREGEKRFNIDKAVMIVTKNDVQVFVQ